MYLRWFQVGSEYQVCRIPGLFSRRKTPWINVYVNGGFYKLNLSGFESFFEIEISVYKRVWRAI